MLRTMGPALQDFSETPKNPRPVKKDALSL